MVMLVWCDCYNSLEKMSDDASFANMTKSSMCKTSIHHLIPENLCRSLADIVCGLPKRNYNSHDPTLLHNIIKLNFLFSLFWLKEPQQQKLLTLGFNDWMDYENVFFFCRFNSLIVSALDGCIHQSMSSLSTKNKSMIYSMRIFSNPTDTVIDL